MKKLLYTLLGLIICCSLSAQNKAEEVKDRAKNKAENRLDNKIDNAIDGGLNKLEGIFKKKKKKKTADTKKGRAKTGNPIFKGLSRTNQPLTIRPVYEFGSDMTFLVEQDNPDKSDKMEQMTFQYFFPKVTTENYLGMKGSNASIKQSGANDMMMVMDNGQMLTFIDQGTIKVVNGITMNGAESADADNASDAGDEKTSEFSKTGRTKVILGYTCEEYVSESDDYKMNFWVAPTMKAQANGLATMFLAMNKNANMPATMFDANKDAGMLLELETLDKENQNRFIMKATALNLEKNTSFSTAGYKQLSLGNIMGGEGN